jgi:hypothetical protein
MFLFGIEHEVAFLNKEGQFADFSNTSFEDFQQIVSTLPENTTMELHKDNYGIKNKKWYVEGMDRYDEKGKFSHCIPKGIEIRTGVHQNIQDCVNELTENYELLDKAARGFKFTPFSTSFNPHLSSYESIAPLNDYEKEFHKRRLERALPHIHLLSYGPDLNISNSNWSKEDALDFGKKLIYYSPSIIPFSFNLCFYKGKIWKGKSIRTFFRNGEREAVRIYVESVQELLGIDPEPIKVAHSPMEIGRIEFKTLDSCAEFSIYASLFALLKGLALDNSLKGRAVVPSKYWHKVAARHGFKSKRIAQEAKKVLGAAQKALDEESKALLEPLFALMTK